MHTTTVLIVDDERGPRESLRMILAPEHQVLSCNSGAEALEILHSEKVDLVTVDLNMPGMKGEELIRLVREEFPQTEMIVITGCGSIESAVDGIRYGVFDYLTKPFDVVQVTAAVDRALERQRSRNRLVDFLEGIGEVLGYDRASDEMLSELDSCEGTRERLRSVIGGPALEAAATRGKARSGRNGEFLEVLAETMESRDEYMRGHARRVAFYSGLIAEQLQLSQEESELVRISAFLHDLGKVGVPVEIVAQPGPLLSNQRDRVEQHSCIGERLVKPLGFSSKILSAIRHHHERWDGAGYPDGLASNEVPLPARIIAVADAFDAMTCERPYRVRMSIDDAIDELRKYSGSQFDTHVVEQFLEVVESGAADWQDAAQSQSHEPLSVGSEVSA